MDLYRRRLPHVFATDQPVFLTWRLHGSLPQHRYFRGANLSSGHQFVAMDRLLDEATNGCAYLRKPVLADMVADTIVYNAYALAQYELHAFVVMPNHVHVLATPAVPVAILAKSLKGATAKRANATLGLDGRPFWQEETYDHTVRSRREFERIKLYVENDPVRAGLVLDASEYRWSSAGWTSWPPTAGPGIRPPLC